MGLPVLTWAGLLSMTAAIAAPDYGALRGSAEPVNNLGRFLERYLGDCESSDRDFDKRGCELEAQNRRKKLADHLLLLEIDSPEEQVHFAEWDRSQRAYRLHLTPFFGERALALSVGRPEKLSREGLPVVKNVPIWVKLPKGEEEVAFRRALERGMVRLELLLRPRKPWRMKRKAGDGEYRGLDVALVGLRIYPLRGQRVLAEQTY